MADFDVFNGDADGIISLLQLRCASPRTAELVTGRKRDIQLLHRVNAKEGDQVTVLDISMRSNIEDLKRILGAGAFVFYADHHNAGEIPRSENLTAIIDTAPEQCTAMIVDTCLNGAYRAWAITAAYGDNFPALAERKARGADLPLDKLARLGMLFNYNGYGASIDDLHLHPADLYRAAAAYDTPMEFMDARSDIIALLDDGYETDLARAQGGKILTDADSVQAILLPDSASSRRISGVYGNMLAQKFPGRAHAILTENGGSYVVSVRAPLENRRGADALCLRFETGGGRAAAAGINALPPEEMDNFLGAFAGQFGK